MGDVKADFTAQHFDCGLEQDDGDSAVDVVVAVEKDGFSRGDGAFEALDRNGHAKHEERIVKMRRLRVEEGEGLGGSGDSARNEQLCEYDWQARFAGERSRLVGVWVGEEPALRRQSAS
jgi:hypothetical protein